MSAAEDDGDFARLWERWHRLHEKQRVRPLGFLSITGLHWLSVEPRRYEDVPGEWSCTDDGVRVSLGSDEEFVVDGELVKGGFDFGTVDEFGRRARFGDAMVEVARRDGQYMIRPRHPDNVVRTTYNGTPTFEPSVKWVARGTFIPYDPVQSVTVGASIEGLEHVYASPGEVHFDLLGQRHRLIAFNDEQPNELFIVFRDLTAGSETYAACRFLSVEITEGSSDVALDFNRATNPPCAYTHFATCPLPPPSNRLSIRIEAGEKVAVSPR